MNSCFEVLDGELSGVKLIVPFYIEDNRGYFLKDIERDILKEKGIELDIYEEFETYSVQNVVRGLHFQIQNPQTKIVRVIRGKVRDVLIDLRKGSSSFGQSMQVELSDENRLSVYIPAGFAHGFRVMSKDALVSYKCIGKYIKEFDTGIIWNDETLNIDWGIEKPIISMRDNQHMTFGEFKARYGGL